MATTILIAEDELADLFKEIVTLGKDGQYQIENAETGTEAVRKTRICAPDLIIMDLRLPRLNGVKAIKQIRQFNTEARILAVTAYTDKYTRQAAMDAGANAYLPKPFRIPDFLATIARLLEESV